MTFVLLALLACRLFYFLPLWATTALGVTSSKAKSKHGFNPTFNQLYRWVYFTNTLRCTDGSS